MRHVLGPIVAMAAMLAPIPSQCTIDQDAVWVHGGEYLVAYTLTGCVLQKIPAPKGGCFGIAVDGKRNVWTTDHAPGSNTVSKYSHAGQHLGTFAAGPAAKGTSTVGPIAIDRLDRVYVGDPSPEGNRITKLDADGKVIGTWTAAGMPVKDVAVDREGSVWVLSAGHLERFASDGTVEVRVSLKAPSTGESIQADEWGRITVGGHPRAGGFARFAPDGSLLGSFEPGPAPGDPAAGALGVAPDGKTWVAEPSLRRIAIHGKEGGPLASGLTGDGAASSIAFDAQGNAWIAVTRGADGSAPVQLQVWSPEAAPVLNLAVPGAAVPGRFLGRGDPTGMLRVRIVDPGGDLDGDGHGNFTEWIAGTSPFSSLRRPTSSVFQNAPRIGTTFQMTITVDGGSGQEYFMPFSLNPAPLPLSLLDPDDPRRFPVSIFRAGDPAATDPLWAASTSGIAPWTQVFPDVRGTLGGAGSALIRVAIPRLPSLAGLEVHAAFCTLVPGAISGVKAISPRITFTIR